MIAKKVISVGVVLSFFIPLLSGCSNGEKSKNIENIETKITTIHDISIDAPTDWEFERTEMDYSDSEWIDYSPTSHSNINVGYFSKSGVSKESFFGVSKESFFEEYGETNITSGYNLSQVKIGKHDALKGIAENIDSEGYDKKMDKVIYSIPILDGHFDFELVKEHGDNSYDNEFELMVNSVNIPGGLCLDDSVATTTQLLQEYADGLQKSYDESDISSEIFVKGENINITFFDYDIEEVEKECRLSTSKDEWNSLLNLYKELSSTINEGFEENGMKVHSEIIIKKDRKKDTLYTVKVEDGEVTWDPVNGIYK